MSAERLTIDSSENGLPSLLVDADILRPYFKKKAGNAKLYAVKNSLFIEEEECELRGELRQFEVHIRKVENNFFKMENNDVYCSTPTESDVSELEEDTSDKEIDISIQTAPHGLIVNSTVYLTNHQWHTMVFIDIQLVKCMVCRTVCVLDSCPGHMESPYHLKNLADFVPLEKFDMSITRKIGDQYHCGVCNESFKICDEDEHYTSKTHEGNLLFAINKVSDLMYDGNSSACSSARTDTHNSRTDTLNSRPDTLNSRTDTLNSRTDTHNSRTDTYPPLSYNPRQTNDWFYLDPPASSNYDSCSSHSYDYEEEYNEPIKGMSYASMAGKPKSIDPPKFLDIDLGTKSVRVRYESWHMINVIKLNNYYCMVCKKQDHIRFKPEHCLDPEHVDRLARCTIAEEFEGYLIRSVDGGLYHCGHCNNLRPMHDMAAHIAAAHPKKTENIIDNPNQRHGAMSKNKDGGQKCKTTAENARGGKKLDYNQIKCNPSNNVLKPPDLNSTVVICPFGYKVCVTFLAYNIVYVTETSERFYCRICDFPLKKEDVVPHIYTLQHIQLIQRTPFIGPFTNSLIRAVRNCLHCAICNVFIPANVIYDHTMNQDHTRQLAKALGILPSAAQAPDEVSDSQNLPQATPSGVQNVRAPAIASVSRPPVSSQVNVASPIGTQNCKPHGPKMVANASKNKNSVVKPILPKTADMPNPVQSPSVVQSASHKTGNTNQTNHLIPTPNIQTTTMTNGAQSKIKKTKPPTLQKIKSDTTISSPELVTKEPELVTNKPELVTNEPNLVKEKPELVTNKPESLRNECALVSNERQVVTNKSERVTKEPELVTNKPESVTKQPELVTIEAELITNEPELVTREPELATNEPELVTNELDPEPNELDESFESAEDVFDSEQHVYVKLKNVYYRITNCSYNTLVQTGDGDRYCFVCSSRVVRFDLTKHLESRGHIENMGKYKFLEKHEQHLFRQIYLMYHCGICNVLITRKFFKEHPKWPQHVSRQESTSKDAKRLRKSELKSGVKECNMSTQKEAIFLHEKEPKIKIDFDYAVKADDGDSKTAESYNSTRNKIIIINNEVLKILSDNWHSVTKYRNIYKCLICQTQLRFEDINYHLRSAYHSSSLNKPFEKQFYPALIRQINDSSVHCLMCNIELVNKDGNIDDHLCGRRHAKNYAMVKKVSSETKSYADCDADVLNL